MARELATPSSSTNPPMISSPCSSGSCPVTLTPYEFHQTIATWIHHFEATFSVLAGSAPAITFSPIQTAEGSPIASASGNKESSSIPISSSDPPIQTPAISQGGNTAPATENNQPPSTPSSFQAPGAASYSKGSPQSGQSNKNFTTPDTPKSAPQTPAQNLTSPPLSEQTGSTSALQPSNDPQSSNDAGSQNSPPSSESPTTTPPPTTSQRQRSSIGTTPSFRLGSSPDDEQMSSMLATLTGGSSAEVAVMLSNRPTNTAIVAWEDLGVSDKSDSDQYHNWSSSCYGRH